MIRRQQEDQQEGELENAKEKKNKKNNNDVLILARVCGGKNLKHNTACSLDKMFQVPS